ncbi:uncharacterized protein [Dermacentor albipictus]|uniref:uncharacterized protein isoform X3 n=1 Tax=Dermacentor albipictus TaxID=60249 RepID=UPI0031FD31AA
MDHSEAHDYTTPSGDSSVSYERSSGDRSPVLNIQGSESTELLATANLESLEDRDWDPVILRHWRTTEATPKDTPEGDSWTISKGDSSTESKGDSSTESEGDSSSTSEGDSSTESEGDSSSTSEGDSSTISEPASEGTWHGHSDMVTSPPDERNLSRSLICTFGTKLNSATVFPPDGLCNYIFFDSLYKNGTNKLDGDSSPNFIYFKEKAMEHNETNFGVGLDFESYADVEKFLNSDHASPILQQLVRGGIHHYGVINTPVTPLWTTEVKQVLKMLKAFDSLMEHEETENMPLYTAFTASMYTETLFNNFTTLFKTVFAPDFLILYGHFFAEDQSWPDCQIVPPTFDTPPESGGYIFSLKTAHSNAKELQRVGIPALTVAVSVAMFGRWYKPRHANEPGAAGGPGSYSLFSMCEPTGDDEQLGSVTQACRLPMWSSRVYSTEHHSEYCYDMNMERIFTFDTATTLREKLCLQKARVGSVNYALAAFNLEYADGRGECGEGDFSELRALRRLVDENFSDDDCAAIRQPSEQTASDDVASTSAMLLST